MTPGTMVRIRPDRIINEDSLMPLWGTTRLMDAYLTGDAMNVGEVTGWMGADDTGTVLEVDPASLTSYTPTVKVLTSRGGIGWINSVYLREIK